ncbi:MAG: TIGR01906 family membrane protein [Clostridia bacterium]|jgi:integral membrane protein (TIGR01906 family)
MKIAIRVISIFFAIILCITFLLASIEFIGFNRNIYKRIQVRYEIAEYAYMSQDTLDNVTDVLIGYMSGESDDIDIFAEIKGQQERVFGIKEKIHMSDVRELFIMMDKVILISICLLVLLLLAGMIIDMESMKEIFLKTVLITMIIVVAVFIMLIFYIIIDFYGFWLTFHDLIFDNDLYYLNPDTDTLINIMTEDFFMSICMNVGLVFGLSFIVSFVMMYGARKIYKVQNDERIKNQED